MPWGRWRPLCPPCHLRSLQFGELEWTGSTGWPSFPTPTAFDLPPFALISGGDFGALFDADGAAALQGVVVLLWLYVRFLGDPRTDAPAASVSLGIQVEWWRWPRPASVGRMIQWLSGQNKSGWSQGDHDACDPTYRDHMNALHANLNDVSLHIPTTSQFPCRLGELLVVWAVTNPSMLRRGPSSLQQGIQRSQNPAAPCRTTAFPAAKPWKTCSSSMVVNKIQSS